MKKGVLGIALVGLTIAGVGLGYLLRDESTGVKTTYARPDAFAQKGQAMVPWRNPQEDMAQLFPGAPLPDSTAPKIVSLAARRATLIPRLGKDTPLDSNVLYVYPVPDRGAVLLRRTAGEFGAIEVVLGIDTQGKAVGMRLQRHREPPEIESVLTSATFLKSVVGKTAESDFSLPIATPTTAKRSAQAVLRAVRALLIEYDAGTRA